MLGGLLFLVSLAGVVLGLYMALNHATREPGIFFALWWTPAVAGSAGIMMRDPVTFLIGVLCFAVAGMAFYSGRRDAGRSKPRGGPGYSEATTQKRVKTNRTRRRAAS